MPNCHPDMDNCSSIQLSARKTCLSLPSSSFCRLLQKPFFVGFNKGTYELWASSLHFEIMALYEWQRSATDLTTGDFRGACLLPAAEMHVLLGRDEDSFHVLAVCIPRGTFLTLLIFTFEWMTHITAVKPEKLKAFNWWSQKVEEEVNWSHRGGGKTIPISRPWSQEAFLATYIWIFPQH